MQRILALAALFAAAPPMQVGDSVPAILRALRLPALVTEARLAGVTDSVVREVLDGLRRRGLPADEAAIVVGEEVDAVHAGAPKNNFGGRALAEAIRAEHRARGIGRPEGRPPQARDTIKPERRVP